MPDRPAAPPESDLTSLLNPHEQAILELLAHGHTVKSIASQLGRTESSINERLREARRKSGIGSSRELAREFAAQKNRDEKSGISEAKSLPATSAERHPAPSTRRRLAIMLMLSAAALAAYAAAGIWTGTNDAGHPAATRIAAPASPLEGTWQVDVERLPMPAAERPRRVTISFAFLADDQLRSEVRILGSDGSERFAAATCRLDATPCTRIAGNMDWLDSASLRRPAPNTLVEVLGKNGAPVSTRVYTVAKDRRTMTETVTWSAGNATAETNVFTRVR